MLRLDLEGALPFLDAAHGSHFEWDTMRERTLEKRRLNKKEAGDASQVPVPDLRFKRKIVVPIQVKTVHGFSLPWSKKCGRFTKKLLEKYVGCVFLLYDYEPEVEGKHWYFASDARSLLRLGHQRVRLPRPPVAASLAT